MFEKVMRSRHSTVGTAKDDYFLPSRGARLGHRLSGLNRVLLRLRTKGERL